MKKTDEELIKEAWELDYIHWSRVDELIEQAESEHTKQKLLDIQKSLYHREEAAAGCL